MVNETILQALEAHGLQKTEGEDSDAILEQEIDDLLKVSPPENWRFTAVPLSVVAHSMFAAS